MIAVQVNGSVCIIGCLFDLEFGLLGRYLIIELIGTKNGIRNNLENNSILPNMSCGK